MGHQGGGPHLAMNSLKASDLPCLLNICLRLEFRISMQSAGGIDSRKPNRVSGGLLRFTAINHSRASCISFSGVIQQLAGNVPSTSAFACVLSTATREFKDPGTGGGRGCSWLGLCDPSCDV